MNLKSRIKDSFPAGLIAGAIVLVVVYLVINFIRLQLIDYTNNPYIFKPPAVQLFCLIPNILLFRWVMINLEKEKTGKGILFVTVFTTFVYFLVFYRFIHNA